MVLCLAESYHCLNLHIDIRRRRCQSNLGGGCFQPLIPSPDLSVDMTKALDERGVALEVVYTYSARGIASLRMRVRIVAIGNRVLHTSSLLCSHGHLG
jgi:hypothetical protein